MAADKRRRRGARAKRPLLLGGLAAFLLIDVALVGFALSGANDALESDAATTQPLPSASSDDASSTPSPTASMAEDSALTPPTWYLSAVDATVAYRASAGACPPSGAPVLQKTTDAGSTWASSALTTDLASVFRVQAVDSTYAYLVGKGGAECAPGLTATYTSGAGFQTYPDRLASTWYLDPAVPTVVHSPMGDVPAPCDAAVALAPNGDSSAAVLCADRTAFRTTDGGVTWDAGVAVPGASALASTGSSYLLGAQNIAGCTGVSIVGLGAEGDEPVAVGCSGDRPVATAPGQELTLSAAGGAVWLAIGESVAVSLDGGVTW